MLQSKGMYPYRKRFIEREDSNSNLLAKQQNIVETSVAMSSDGRFINGVVERNSMDERNQLPKFAEEDECGSRPSTLPLVKSKRKSDYNLKRQESIEKFNQVFQTELDILKKKEIYC